MPGSSHEPVRVAAAVLRLGVLASMIIVVLSVALRNLGIRWLEPDYGVYVLAFTPLAGLVVILVASLLKRDFVTAAGGLVLVAMAAIQAYIAAMRGYG